MPMIWYCCAKGCGFQSEDKEEAKNHAETALTGPGLHVLYLRESALALAVQSMHASDAGGVYVDTKLGGMLSCDPLRFSK